MTLGPLKHDGAHKFACLADLEREAWAAPQGFPGLYQNTGDDVTRFSWTGHRGAYYTCTPVSSQSVSDSGYQRGIDPDDNTVSATYAIPAMGYNRCRVFAIATGSAGQMLQVLAMIWQNQTANECDNAIVLANAIPADNKLRFYDCNDYLGPWMQVKAVAMGDYTLTSVSVTIHLWKE